MFRPEGLEIFEVDIGFNLQIYKFLEIDLVHINKNGRSNYSVQDIIEIFIILINGLILTPSDEKFFGDEMCSYFVKSGICNNKKLKVVFCICSDRPSTIGVITLYRI